MAVVSSVAVGPAIADDDVTIDSDGISVGDDVDAGTDGVSVGDDDGVSVSAGDDGDVSVSGSGDESGAEAGADGSAGDSSGGVDCQVDSSTSENPCTTSGADGPDAPAGEAPSVIDAGALPADPTVVGTEDHVARISESYPDAAPLDGYIVGGVHTRSAGAGTATYGPNGQGVIVGGSYSADDGTASVSTLSTINRSAGTTVSCDLSAGYLRLCGVKNTVPSATEQVPQDQLPSLEGTGLSYGLLFLLVETGAQEPTALVNLAIGTSSGETPEQSPIDPARPPYNPNNPPINLANPQEDVNPDTTNEGSGTMRMVGVSVNDGIGATVFGTAGQSGAGSSISASDGQNGYAATVSANQSGVSATKGGFVGGSATLTQDTQKGSMVIDLGGKPYSREFGGDSGGDDGGSSGPPSPPEAPSRDDAPSLPFDPSNPPDSPDASVSQPGASQTDDGGVTFHGGGSGTLDQQTGPGAGAMVFGGGDASSAGVAIYGSGTGDSATVISASPEQGTSSAGTTVSPTDQAVGTTVSCDLSAGYLRLCGVKNTVPSATEQVPQDQLPSLEGTGLSYGLLFLLVETGAQEPTALVNLAIGTAGGETPEQSPINPARPPYNPNNPPINLANPQEDVNPDTTNEGSGTMRIIGASVNEEIGAVAFGVVGPNGAGSSISASDGQNGYAASGGANSSGVSGGTQGPVNSDVTLTQDEQSGSGEIDLGGKPYGRSFGGSSSSSSFPIDASQLPADPSVPA